MANDANNDDNKQNEGNDNNKAAEQNNNNNANNGNNGNNGNNSNSSANNASNGQNNNNGGNSSNGSNNQGGKSFSQDEVNRMMAKEKQQGRNSVFNELGINPDDSETMELIKALIAVKSNSGSNNSGNGTANNNNADFEAAKERAVIAELKLDAIKAGVSPQYVDDAVDLALARFTGENDDINTILSELKPKYPIWFNDSDDSENNAGKKGTGSSLSSNKNGGGKNNEQVGIGKRLAGLRKPTQQKKSYFSS